MTETLSLMGNGFISALYPVNLLAMTAGVTIGIVIGCLPGLSAAMGVALLLLLGIIQLRFGMLILYQRLEHS